MKKFLGSSDDTLFKEYQEPNQNLHENRVFPDGYLKFTKLPEVEISIRDQSVGDEERSSDNV